MNDLLDPDNVDEFYSECDNCKKWISFIRPAQAIAKHRDKPYTIDEIKELGFSLEQEVRIKLRASSIKKVREVIAGAKDELGPSAEWNEFQAAFYEATKE